MEDSGGGMNRGRVVNVYQDGEPVGRVETIGRRPDIMWGCLLCGADDDLARGWGEAVDGLLAHLDTEHEPAETHATGGDRPGG
jgi:hypothetical protein